MSTTKDMLRKVTKLDELEQSQNVLDMVFSIDDKIKEPKIDSVQMQINSGRGSFTISFENESNLQKLYNLCNTKIIHSIDDINDQLTKLLDERLNLEENID